MARVGGGGGGGGGGIPSQKTKMGRGFFGKTISLAQSPMTTKREKKRVEKDEPKPLVLRHQRKVGNMIHAFVTFNETL